MSAPRLDTRNAALVVIDVQEAFRKAVPEFGEIARAVGVMVEGAEALGVPILVTEQYPKGLGRTVPEVADRLPGEVRPIEKLCFSAREADGFELGDRRQAVICGVEAHVCVNQTALDLLDAGIEVHVVRDAVGSRTVQNRELGLRKVERAGAWLTSVETALFELVRRAGTEEFKRVQELILDWAPLRPQRAPRGSHAAEAPASAEAR